MPCCGEEVGLLVRRQEHVETLAREKVEREVEKRHRLAAHRRAAVEAPHEPRKATDASRVGIADLEVVPGQPQRGDRFARREARPFGQENP